MAAVAVKANIKEVVETMTTYVLEMIRQTIMFSQIQRPLSRLVNVNQPGDIVSLCNLVECCVSPKME